MSDSIDRRTFVRRAALLSGGALMAPSLSGLAACADSTGPRPRALSYGPLEPSSVPELWAPAGFTVAKLSTTLQPSAADAAWTVPYGLDGMAAFAGGRGIVRLVRNHEIRDSAATSRLLSEAGPSYDRRAGGGTSTLELRQHRDGSVALLREFVSLSGTLTNCAGGPTPWGSWITCEETTAGTRAGYEKAHGYCFEVAAGANGPVEPVPLPAMGRFVHEAVAIDPQSGIVHLTEDVIYDAARSRGSGFYRFLPDSPGALHRGGRLQMLAVVEQPRYDTTRGQQPGATLPVAWVDIPDPDPADAETNSAAVFQQGWAEGAAVFQRLEGCWWGDGNVYFNATSGGDAGAGQVWGYRPDGPERGVLKLIFESPSRDVLDSPDNLCTSPRGGLVLCEDGRGEQFLRGLTPDGRIFDFVRSAAASAEFAGACFSPNGRTLFFNIQGGTRAAEAATTPGGTYAIWGPWERGSL